MKIKEASCNYDKKVKTGWKAAIEQKRQNIVQLYDYLMESTRGWSNKWSKTLYQHYLHGVANSCMTVLNIFSKKIICSNTKH